MFNIQSSSSTPSSSFGFISFNSHPASSTPSVRYGSGDSLQLASNSECAITSIEFGELSELPPSNEIMKTLECPVCKEIPYPPIFNCTSGHSICGTCRPKLANCALCKADYTEGRNYSLESLVLNSKFHCHYKSRGCSTVVTGENYREHLRNCQSRPGSGIVTEGIVSRMGALSVGNRSYPPYLSQSPCSSQERVDDDEDNSEDYTSISSSEFADFEFVSWIKCKNGQFPEQDAVVAGYSAGFPVFVARAYQGSRLIMGRLIPSERAAYVYWHGCQKKWYYEILVAVPDTVKWVDASWGDVPVNAVSGGQSPDRENVYIGRAQKNGQYVPGFVQPTCQGIYIGVGQQLYLCHDYQVLVFDIDRT